MVSHTFYIISYTQYHVWTDTTPMKTIADSSFLRRTPLYNQYLQHPAIMSLKLNEEMFLHWLCNRNSNCEKKKLLGCELSMVKISQLLNELGFQSWWFPSLYLRGQIPLGDQVYLCVTNYHHLWSLHKGYLWMSPQRMQQINLMVYKIEWWIPSYKNSSDQTIKSKLYIQNEPEECIS